MVARGLPPLATPLLCSWVQELECCKSVVVCVTDCAIPGGRYGSQRTNVTHGAAEKEHASSAGGENKPPQLGHGSVKLMLAVLLMTLWSEAESKHGKQSHRANKYLFYFSCSFPWHQHFGA